MHNPAVAALSIRACPWPEAVCRVMHPPVPSFKVSLTFDRPLGANGCHLTRRPARTYDLPPAQSLMPLAGGLQGDQMNRRIARVFGAMTVAAAVAAGGTAAASAKPNLMPTVSKEIATDRESGG